MTQHPTQDSQSELEFWEAMFGKSTNAKGNAEGYITYADFTKRLEAYVTTRVKEADEKAHLIGFKNGKRAAIKRMNDLWTTIMVDEVGSEKAFAYKEAIEAALTTTTNGKGGVGYE